MAPVECSLTPVECCLTPFEPCLERHPNVACLPFISLVEHELILTVSLMGDGSTGVKQHSTGGDAVSNSSLTAL